MKLAGLLLFAVVGWASLGAIGIVISLVRKRRADAIRQSVWLVAILGLYLIILITVSAMQPQRLIPIGQDKCFGAMCFAVITVDRLPSLVAGDPGHVIRVSIRVSNHAASANDDSLVRAYLLDSKGRTWPPLVGLSGNRLTARVAGGSQMLSQPIFQVAPDSTALRLVFSRGHWQPGRLTLGDTDSIAHKPDAVPLDITLPER